MNTRVNGTIKPDPEARPIDAIIAASDEIMSGLSDYLSDDLTTDDEQEAADLVRRILAQIEPDPDAQPVAWRVRIKSDDPEEWTLMPTIRAVDYVDRDGYDCQPLYAAPSTSSPPTVDVDEFDRGYVIACCNVVNLHDEPGIARDVFEQLDVSREEIKAMDLSEYDTKALRKIEKARPGSPYTKLGANETPIHAHQPALSATDAPQAEPSNAAGELLPCPFCGGEASADGVQMYGAPLADTWWDDGSEITEAFFCNCMRCGISNTVGTVGYRTRVESIAAWNRRARAALRDTEASHD